MAFEDLIQEVRACRLCAADLPHGPRPVLQVDPRACILIVGQAPGRKVHESGMPFDDASGERLRAWLGIDRETFYDASKVAILPMGFCFPGSGSSGDLPPRPECARTWRTQLLAQLTNIQMTLVIGTYAMAYHLPQATGNLTDTVLAWREFRPLVWPLPHPSPRNRLWLKRNPWFETELLPELQLHVQHILLGGQDESDSELEQRQG